MENMQNKLLALLLVFDGLFYLYLTRNHPCMSSLNVVWDCKISLIPKFLRDYKSKEKLCLHVKQIVCQLYKQQTRKNLSRKHISSL